MRNDIKNSDSNLPESFSHILWYLSLFISSIFYILSLAFQYIRYGVDYPLGWDPVYYVGLANSIFRNGSLTYLLNNNFFTQLVALLGFLLQNTKLSLIIIESSSALLMIYLFSIVAFHVTNSYGLAALTAILTPFTANFVRFHALPRQIFVLPLTLVVLKNIPYIIDNFNIKCPRSWFIVIASAMVCWVCSINSFFPLLITLFLIYILCRLKTQKRNLMKFILLTAIIGMTPQISSLLALYRDVIITNPAIYPAKEATYSHCYSILIKWMGGNDLLLLASLSGVMHLAMKAREEKNLTAMVFLSWIIICLALFVISILIHPWFKLWYIYAERSLLILPVPLILVLGLESFSKILKDWCLRCLNLNIQQ